MLPIFEVFSLISLDVNISLKQTIKLSILALCEVNLKYLIDSINYSVRGYLLLIRKDSATYMHGLAVCVKEGFPFKWGLSLQNSLDSYLFSTGFISFGALLLFPLSFAVFVLVHGF